MKMIQTPRRCTATVATLLLPSLFLLALSSCQEERADTLELELTPESRIPWRLNWRSLAGRSYRLLDRLSFLDATATRLTKEAWQPAARELELSMDQEALEWVSSRDASADSREGGDGPASLWEADFPVPLLLTSKGQLRENSLSALRVRVDGEPFQYVRNLSSEAYWPGTWGCSNDRMRIATSSSTPPQDIMLEYKEELYKGLPDLPAAWNRGHLPRALFPIEETRHDALLLLAPTTLSDRLEVPERAWLEFTYGIHWPLSLEAPVPVLLRVTFSEKEGTPTRHLLDMRLDATLPRNRSWQKARVSLETLAGLEGTLRFDILASDGGGARDGNSRDEARALVALAHPRVITLKKQEAEAREEGKAGSRAQGQVRSVRSRAQGQAHSRLSKAGTGLSVVLILLDTLRQDMVTAPENARATTHLRAMAKEGVLFQRAVSSSSWTAPAVASFFSGLYPAALGMHGAPNNKFLLMPIPPQAPSVIAPLRQSGYATWSFQTNRILQLEGRFEHFDACHYAFDAPASEVVDAAIEFLADRGQEPFAAYLHFLDPHTPYDYHPGLTKGPAEELELMSAEPGSGGRRATRFSRTLDLEPDDVDRIWRLYRGEVRYLDQELGRFFAWMRAHGLFEHTLLVVASDHGEEFWEHGKIGHGIQHHAETDDALLLLRLPDVLTRGQAASSLELRRQAASLVDLRATILDLLGFPVNPPNQGRSLFADVAGGPPRTAPLSATDGELPRARGTRESGEPPPRALFSESTLTPKARWAVTVSSWRLLHDEGGATRLFDRATDPLEQRDLASVHPEKVKELVAQYETHTKASQSILSTLGEGKQQSPMPELSPEALEQLRTLGYVE